MRAHKGKSRRRWKRAVIMPALLLCVVGVIIKMSGGQQGGDIYTSLANSAVVTGNNVNSDEWNLMLVNRWNPIPEGFETELTELRDGHSIDSRAYPDLQEMFDDARAEGIRPYIYSSYRTTEIQQQLFEDEIATYRNQGYSYEEAKEIAQTWVAIPGTSEHQIGLALDITSENQEAQDPSVVWEWLEQNSYKYGFIVRYPEDKTKITGICYEPWHFRYVGKDAAKEIHEKGVCLEEYLDKVNK